MDLNLLFDAHDSYRLELTESPLPVYHAAVPELVEVTLKER